MRFLVLSLRSDGVDFATDADRQVVLDLAASIRPPNDDLGAQLQTILRAIAQGAQLLAGDPHARCGDSPTRRPAGKRGLRMPPIAVVIDHADTLLPDGDIPRMAPLDRESIKVFADLLRDDDIWAEAETASVYPDVVLLIANAAAELNPRVSTLPRVVHIDVPAPDEATRRAFLEDRLARAAGGSSGPPAAGAAEVDAYPCRSWRSIRRV